MWQIVFEGGAPAMGVLVAAALGGAVAALGALAFAFGRRLPPPIPLAVAAAPLSLAVLHGVLARDLSDIVGAHAPAQVAMLIAQRLSETIGARVAVGFAAFPLGIAILGCGIAGAIRGPRSAVGVAIAAVGVAIEVALPLVLASDGRITGAIVGALVAAVLGVAVALSGTAGAPDKGGPEAAITAGFLYAMVMGAWWASAHAVAVAEIFRAVAMVAPEDKAMLVGQGLQELWLDRWLGVAAVVAGLLPAIGGVVSGRAELPRRLGWFALAIPLWFVPLALVLDDPPAAQLRALLSMGF